MHDQHSGGYVRKRRHQEERLVTRLDSARETAGNLADSAKQRLGPTLDALGPKASQAAHSARVQYDRRIAPQIGHAFASLPPEAQQNTLKAFHRAQEAALAARLAATKAADQARTTVGTKVVQAVEEARATVTPVAQEAQTRSAAALTALHGNVTSAEIGDLAARNRRKAHRSGWATGLAVAGALAIGSGIVAWQWWRHHSNPEWLVEPASGTSPAPARSGGAHASGSGPTDAVNGSRADAAGPGTGGGPEAGGVSPEPGPPVGRPDSSVPSNGSDTGSGPDHGHDDDRPKPHDPRKPH
ncbi:DUF5324 family protein [Streptomyces sp. BE303]|uniref:DUF5324 family protein n=1 Tax=Streptomyces sp. BE303 TaxID=3002528 RepID=UPI002E78F7BE|nr:DUF5324 family protein [Streptomyces sp. BE303]MED7950566.1 DUF5324 family protein [Streptomyces sp. BE303]